MFIYGGEGWNAIYITHCIVVCIKVVTGNQIDKVRQQNTFWHRKLTSYIMKRKLYKNIRFM